jgi:uncharacterized protein (UPF0332 family)
VKEGTKEDLAKYRIEKAKERLKISKELLDLGHSADSLSKSYYAMFSAAKALLALKELDSSKHSGVISLFNRHIVKEGLFAKEYSRLLSEAKLEREEADYEDFVTITKEDARLQLKNAIKFVEEVEKTLNKIIKQR